MYSLEGLAAVIAAEGNPLRAGCLWGAAERLRKDIRAPLPPNERPRYTRHVDTARAAVGDDLAFERAVEEGRAMPLSEAMDLATKRARQSE